MKTDSVDITPSSENQGQRTYDSDGLNSKRRAFVIEYCKDFNATQAAIRAGYSEATAGVIGHEMLKIPYVQSAIERRLAAIAAAAEVDATRVISELATLAFADPRELMTVHQDSCRYCHGEGFKYHWSAPEFEREVNRALKAGEPAPEIEGGFGYDPRRDPNPHCPNCFGRGVPFVAVTDSRKLSRAAARLMASVKVTREGIELKTYDQQAALMALGKVTGIFVERSEISGPGGAPLQLQPVAPRDPRALTDDELRAALKAAGHPLTIEGTITSQGDTQS